MDAAGPSEETRAAYRAGREVVQSRAQIDAPRLDELIVTHRIQPDLLRADDFDGYFRTRRESLCQLVEAAIGKAVQRDIDQGFSEEGSAQFEPGDGFDADSFTTE